jgi:hypothetical protein
VCGRKFGADSIERHQTICAKNAAKKRKKFDATKARCQGEGADEGLKEFVKSGAQMAKKKQAEDKAKRDKLKEDKRKGLSGGPKWKQQSAVVRLQCMVYSG